MTVDTPMITSITVIIVDNGVPSPTNKYKFAMRQLQIWMTPLNLSDPTKTEWPPKSERLLKSELLPPIVSPNLIELP